MPEPRDLKLLPKGHLHLHLEAAMRPQTLDELAGELGVEWGGVPAFTDFSVFSTTYRALLAVLALPRNYERLIDEAVEDAARDGAIYAEFGVAPNFYVDTYGSADDALEATIEYAEAATRRHGVAVGLMVTADRQLSAEQAVADARLAARFAGKGVVGFGLANDERGNPIAKFAEAFRIAKDAGLLVTPHAGELEGPDEVRAAIEVGADRILHGVRAAEDPELVTELAQLGIALDVCPTSNVLLHVVPSLAEHPLPALLEAGVRCSINADDPILFGPGLLDEYVACRESVGLTDEQLAACALTSVEASGAPEHVKDAARAGVAAWLAA